MTRAVRIDMALTKEVFPDIVMFICHLIWSFM